VGAVRVRPTGLSSPAAAKRKKYSRSGARPSASTWTLCASSGVAMEVPWRSGRRKRSSAAISHWTGTLRAGMPPAGSSGFGASRVHSTTPSGVGSPDATPSANGSPSTGRVPQARAGDHPAAAAVSAPPPAQARNALRLHAACSVIDASQRSDSAAPKLAERARDACDQAANAGSPYA
jgi:hypothetical protein